MDEDAPERTKRRTRGQRAGLDRARIVEAARGLTPKEVTMQAVADRLGVDRSALNYHVPDRAALIALIAEDAFAAYRTPTAITSETDWREGCRLLARATRESVLATGPFASYLRLSALPGTDSLGPVEMVLGRMIEAGFELETAAQGIYALSALAMALARGEAAARDEGLHPQVQEIRRALAEADPEAHPLLTRLSGIDDDLFDDASFDASIGMLIDGLAARLG